MTENMNLKEKSALEGAMDIAVSNLLKLKEKISVIGEVTESNGMKIIPVSKVSAGFAGGGADFNDNKKGKKNNPAGTGAGVSENPVAFLIVSDTGVEVINVPSNSKG